MSVVTYIVRKIDLLEFNEFHAKMNGGYGKSITRHRIIWPGIIAFIALFIVMSSQDARLGIYIITGAFVWSLGVPALLQKKFHQHVAEQLSADVLEKSTGEFTLKNTDSGLLEIKPNGEELLEWGKILKIEKSKRYVFLYTGEASAIIIPKETVSEASDFNVFYADLIAALKKENGEATV
ncbi:MAG: hypothetical protein A6F72_03615 [Cycloclasticus sp. symbiont of Poecilosclerida sp. N]|nr:MAG: hypothetical protein A6F72_03615 [Cycloclasticus sp. symbiont of Poecilosclerida sp. N]